MQYLDAISKMTEWSLFISKANHSTSQQSKSMPQPVMLKKLKLNGSMNTYGLLGLTPKKDILFILGDWKVKVGSQEITGETGKFGLEVWNEAGQRLTEVLPREHTGHSKHPLPTIWEDSTCRHYQMGNTKIRLIIFFAAKDGKTAYSHQKQDWELTVAQIVNSLLPNSDEM